MQCSDPDSHKCDMMLVKSAQSVITITLDRTQQGKLVLCDPNIRTFLFVCERCNRHYNVSACAGAVVQFTEGAAQ